MARIRTIKPELWDHEQLNRASLLARLTFVGLISFSDDQGRGKASTELLWGRIHSEQNNSVKAKFRKALRELETIHDANGPLVVFYEVEGARYYWLPGFNKHQRIDKANKSKLPPPPDLSTNVSQSILERSQGDQGSGIKDQGSGKGRERIEEEDGPSPVASLLQPSGDPEFDSKMDCVVGPFIFKNPSYAAKPDWVEQDFAPAIRTGLEVDWILQAIEEDTTGRDKPRLCIERAAALRAESRRETGIIEGKPKPPQLPKSEDYKIGRERYAEASKEFDALDQAKRDEMIAASTKHYDAFPANIRPPDNIRGSLIREHAVVALMESTKPKDPVVTPDAKSPTYDDEAGF